MLDSPGTRAGKQETLGAPWDSMSVSSKTFTRNLQLWDQIAVVETQAFGIIFLDVFGKDG